jgi:hypothetical protein
MRKLVIVALIVTAGIVAYLLSRANKDTSVSVDDNVVGKAKRQPEQQHSQGVNSAAGNNNSTPELTATQRQVAAETAAPAEQTLQPAQPTASTSSTTDMTQAPTFNSLGDQQKEERLSGLLSVKGSDAEKYVEVQSIVCEQGVCTVDAVAKSDAGRFQMTMAFLLEQNPWLGTKVKFQTPTDQPGIATFEFVKE